ncbi:periplasmic nitrate reductase, NapE protein [Pseudomonas sp. DY-1]|uniref:periplasmic nitrate reductase, NapE protein n=1 Tax=Pseudomonas sp. DY-1 TaxID=1755504 RepID=UPI000EA95CFC|nr:periplasmic nitrate reductase, NapE protein [Pseudomonas sp. DY-1]AYF90754.1 periplasmic nitrate reductase, NapE protein [Pseudomonas sp. DY-1]
MANSSYRRRSAATTADSGDRSKRKETRLFLFLVACLFPILAVMIVGGYGFIVWIYQMIAGPSCVKG